MLVGIFDFCGAVRAVAGGEFVDSRKDKTFTLLQFWLARWSRRRSWSNLLQNPQHKLCQVHMRAILLHGARCVTGR